MEQTRDFSLYNLLAVFLLMPLFPSPPTALSINYSSKRIFIERFYFRKEDLSNGGYKTVYSITLVQKLWRGLQQQPQPKTAREISPFFIHCKPDFFYRHKQILLL